MGDVPVAVPNPGLIMASIEQQALARQYVGTLADGDAKSLISRSYNVTKEEAAAIDRVVGSPLTAYISSGDFVRHAIWELLQSYVKGGFPDEFVPDVTNHLKAMRESAHRLKLRQDFHDVLLVYEASVAEGVDVGDWELVDSTLATLEGYVDRTPDIHWKLYLRRTILRSSVIKQAIDSFSEWTEHAYGAHASLKQQYQARAEKWSVWLEGLAD